MTTINAKLIYEKLKIVGLTRAQVRKLLPDWWSPEIEKQPDGFAEFCLFLSRRLSFDLPSLMKGNIVVKQAAASVAYKHRVDATPESLQASTCIATAVAQGVISAMTRPYGNMNHTPNSFSKYVRDIGQGQISFLSVLNACWELGIPVIPLPNVPVGIRKMDGAVIKLNDRPAIIISKKNSSRAWLTFIIAHELGHIANGHLDRDGSIMDVALQEKATFETESSNDVQEYEANSFAFSMLGGEQVTSVINSWPDRISAADIAIRSREASGTIGVESGHFALRYAFRTKRWPDAMNALSFLSEDADPESEIRSVLARSLDFGLISDDIKEYVCQITGIEA